MIGQRLEGLGLIEIRGATLPSSIKQLCDDSRELKLGDRLCRLGG